MRYMLKGNGTQLAGELCPEGKVVVHFPLYTDIRAVINVFGRDERLVASFVLPDGCREITFTDKAPLFEGEIARAKNDQT
jgi:hypothetical protein